MNILDRLFSREIQRRTGAHAINIYIDSQVKVRKRIRARGSNAINATKITTKQFQGSLFHRLNVRFPWLKIVVVILAIGFIVMDVRGVIIPRVGDSFSIVEVAPMSHHVKITERSLEGKMLVALTFDDGPSPETTPKLLEVLTEKDVPATFFMLGMMARNNPGIVREVKKNHHEVASHTTYHQNLIRLNSDAMRSDLDESRAIFREIMGVDPLYVRPPYGNYNDEIAVATGLPLILWSVDTEDWLSKDTGAIVDTAMREVYDGAIILMHDIYPSSVEAVPVLIDAMRGAGYEFATIAEIAQARGVELTPGTAYYGFRL